MPSHRRTHARARTQPVAPRLQTIDLLQELGDFDRLPPPPGPTPTPRFLPFSDIQPDSPREDFLAAGGNMDELHTFRGRWRGKAGAPASRPLTPETARALQSLNPMARMALGITEKLRPDGSLATSLEAFDLASRTSRGPFSFESPTREQRFKIEAVAQPAIHARLRAAAHSLRAKWAVLAPQEQAERLRSWGDQAEAIMAFMADPALQDVPHEDPEKGEPGKTYDPLQPFTFIGRAVAGAAGVVQDILAEAGLNPDVGSFITGKPSRLFGEQAAPTTTGGQIGHGLVRGIFPTKEQVEGMPDWELFLYFIGFGGPLDDAIRILFQAPGAFVPAQRQIIQLTEAIRTATRRPLAAGQGVLSTHAVAKQVAAFFREVPVLGVAGPPSRTVHMRTVVQAKKRRVTLIKQGAAAEAALNRTTNPLTGAARKAAIKRQGDIRREQAELQRAIAEATEFTEHQAALRAIKTTELGSAASPALVSREAAAVKARAPDGSTTQIGPTTTLEQQHVALVKEADANKKVKVALQDDLLRELRAGEDATELVASRERLIEQAQGDLKQIRDSIFSTETKLKIATRGEVAAVAGRTPQKLADDIVGLFKGAKPISGKKTPRTLEEAETLLEKWRDKLDDVQAKFDDLDNPDTVRGVDLEQRIDTATDAIDDLEPRVTDAADLIEDAGTTPVASPADAPKAQKAREALEAELRELKLDRISATDLLDDVKKVRGDERVAVAGADSVKLRAIQREIEANTVHAKRLAEDISNLQEAFEAAAAAASPSARMQREVVAKAVKRVKAKPKTEPKPKPLGPRLSAAAKKKEAAEAEARMDAAILESIERAKDAYRKELRADFGELQLIHPIEFEAMVDAWGPYLDGVEMLSRIAAEEKLPHSSAFLELASGWGGEKEMLFAKQFSDSLTNRKFITRSLKSARLLAATDLTANNLRALGRRMQEAGGLLRNLVEFGNPNTFWDRTSMGIAHMAYAHNLVEAKDLSRTAIPKLLATTADGVWPERLVVNKATRSIETKLPVDLVGQYGDNWHTLYQRHNEPGLKEFFTAAEHRFMDNYHLALKETVDEMIRMGFVEAQALRQIEGWIPRIVTAGAAFTKRKGFSEIAYGTPVYDELLTEIVEDMVGQVLKQKGPKDAATLRATLRSPDAVERRLFDDIGDAIKNGVEYLDSPELTLQLTIEALLTYAADLRYYQDLSLLTRSAARFVPRTEELGTQLKIQEGKYYMLLAERRELGLSNKQFNKKFPAGKSIIPDTGLNDRLTQAAQLVKEAKRNLANAAHVQKLVAGNQLIRPGRSVPKAFLDRVGNIDDWVFEENEITRRILKDLAGKAKGPSLIRIPFVISGASRLLTFGADLSPTLLQIFATATLGKPGFFLPLPHVAFLRTITNAAKATLSPAAHNRLMGRKAATILDMAENGGQHMHAGQATGGIQQGAAQQFDLLEVLHDVASSALENVPQPLRAIAKLPLEVSFQSLSRAQTFFNAASDSARIELWEAFRPLAVKYAEKNNVPLKVVLHDLGDVVGKAVGFVDTRRMGMSDGHRYFEGAFFASAPRLKRAIAGLYGDALTRDFRGEVARELLLKGLGGMITATMMWNAADAYRRGERDATKIFKHVADKMLPLVTDRETGKLRYNGAWGSVQMGDIQVSLFGGVMLPMVSAIVRMSTLVVNPRDILSSHRSPLVRNVRYWAAPATNMVWLGAQSALGRARVPTGEQLHGWSGAARALSSFTTPIAFSTFFENRPDTSWWQRLKISFISAMGGSAFPRSIYLERNDEVDKLIVTFAKRLRDNARDPATQELIGLLASDPSGGVFRRQMEMGTATWRTAPSYAKKFMLRQPEAEYVRELNEKADRQTGEFGRNTPKNRILFMDALDEIAERMQPRYQGVQDFVDVAIAESKRTGNPAFAIEARNKAWQTLPGIDRERGAAVVEVLTVHAEAVDAMDKFMKERLDDPNTSTLDIAINFYRADVMAGDFVGPADEFLSNKWKKANHDWFVTYGQFLGIGDPSTPIGKQEDDTIKRVREIIKRGQQLGTDGTVSIVIERSNAQFVLAPYYEIYKDVFFTPKVRDVYTRWIEAIESGSAGLFEQVAIERDEASALAHARKVIGAARLVLRSRNKEIEDELVRWGIVKRRYFFNRGETAGGSTMADYLAHQAGLRQELDARARLRRQ